MAVQDPTTLLNLLGGLQSQNVVAQDPTIDDLLRQATDPGYMPPPVEPEKIPLAQRILAALGDAGTTYARGINPNVQPTNFTQTLRQLQEYRAARETDRIRREAAQKNELSRERARLQIGERRAQSEAERDEQRRQEDLKFRQDSLAAQQRSESEARDLRREIAQMEDRTRRAIASSKGETISNSRRESSSSAASRIMEGIIGTKSQLQSEGLAGRTADQIREDFLDAIEVSNLLPADQERVMMFYKTRIEPILSQMEQEAAKQQSDEEYSGIADKRMKQIRRQKARDQGRTELQFKVDEMLSDPSSFGRGLL